MKANAINDLLSKNLGKSVIEASKPKKEKYTGPTVFGCLTYGQGLILMGVLDFIILTALISLIAVGMINDGRLISMCVIFYGPSFIAFLVVLFADSANTRIGYYFVLLMKLLV